MRFSGPIRLLLLRKMKGVDLVLYKIMFYVAFGKKWASLSDNNMMLRISVNMFKQMSGDMETNF